MSGDPEQEYFADGMVEEIPVTDVLDRISERCQIMHAMGRWWLTDHEEPTRQGSRHRQNAPYQRIRTADGYLMIGAAGESIWVRCAEAGTQGVV